MEFIENIGELIKSWGEDVKAIGTLDLLHYDKILIKYIQQKRTKSVDDRELAQATLLSLMAQLPSTSKRRDFLESTLIHNFWDQLLHPPVPWAYQLGPLYRAADGYGNNPSLPDVGRAGTPYIRHVASKNPRLLDGSTLPDPGTIFDKLFKRKKGEFKPHPSGISSIAFYFATLITHDLFNSNSINPEINQTTSYLDLSWLYGWNQKMQESIRTRRDGRIKNDILADPRLLFQPPGVSALALVFSRNHNWLAEQLVINNSDDPRFKVKSDDAEGTQEQTQRDEAIFQTVRAINIGAYVTVIVRDYLRYLTGTNRPIDKKLTSFSLTPQKDFSYYNPEKNAPSATGNQSAAEFNFIYRFHSIISQEDEQWLNSFVQQLAKSVNMEGKSVLEILTVLRSKVKDNVADNLKYFPGVERDPSGKYPDEVIAKYLAEGATHRAGAFGARHVPEILRDVEILGIKHGRQLRMCSLNEYRKFLGLKTLATFEEINSDPEIAAALRDLYTNVDDVELYTGIVVEETQTARHAGVGLDAGYTIAAALYGDAVALVRGDRFLTIDFNSRTLTKWGLEQCSYDESHNYGYYFGEKLLSRHFGAFFKPNSVGTIFPFTVPAETAVNVKDAPEKLSGQWTD